MEGACNGLDASVQLYVVIDSDNQIVAMHERPGVSNDDASPSLVRFYTTGVSSYQYLLTQLNDGFTAAVESFRM